MLLSLSSIGFCSGFTAALASGFGLSAALLGFFAGKGDLDREDSETVLPLLLFASAALRGGERDGDLARLLRGGLRERESELL